MSRLTRDGTAEPVSRDQILRHARGQGNVHFPCSADHEQDWQPYPVDPYSAICDDHTYIHTYKNHGRQGYKSFEHHDRAIDPLTHELEQNSQRVFWHLDCLRPLWNTISWALSEGRSSRDETNLGRTFKARRALIWPDLPVAAAAPPSPHTHPILVMFLASWPVQTTTVEDNILSNARWRKPCGAMLSPGRGRSQCRDACRPRGGARAHSLQPATPKLLPGAPADSQGL